MIDQQNIVNFTSLIGVDFWNELTKKKLDEYQLDDSEKQIYGRFKINNNPSKSCHLSLDVYSFMEDMYKQVNQTGPVDIKIAGKIINLNKYEQFQNYDFKGLSEKILDQLFTQVQQFVKGEIETIQNSFNLITFADLKKYLFSYKFMFPSLQIEKVHQIDMKKVSDYFEPEIQKNLAKSIEKYFYDENSQATFSPYSFVLQQNNQFEFISMRKYFELYFLNNEQIYFVYYDAFNQPSGVSTQIQNLLSVFASYNKNDKKCYMPVKTILLKDMLIYNPNNMITFKNSFVWQLDLSSTMISKVSSLNDNPIKQVDLKGFMDERTLAQNSVDLNIKLMKWRLLPELDMDILKNTKCLLFGAGTLGCQLSRNLIGWNIRNITFVDYGKVSYSNPVRQSLFDYEDTINGGKFKATCAAEKLIKIFPEINSTGHVIEIPMPGHFISSQEHAQKIVENLKIIDNLVESHDVIYLLTDTRESRWLPTLLANKYNKICISVALGFDSFLVVRHGATSDGNESCNKEDRLACYFCNDIISPTNTLNDRTLDQQCTVTRPGVSFIGASYASELLVSLLHHPLKNKFYGSENESEESPLGLIPQHIRGNVSDFETRLYYGKAFKNCVACSNYVLNEYKQKNHEFILEVMNNPDYLQDVSLITEQIKDMNIDDAIIEFNDE